MKKSLTGRTFAARIDQARSRAGNVGYDIRRIREWWRQTPTQFGRMLGQGLLSGVLVERWESGIERPPEWVLQWIRRQWLYAHYARLVKCYQAHAQEFDWPGYHRKKRKA